MGLAADATPKPPSATPLSEPLASLLPFRLPHPAFPGRDQTGAEVLVEPLPRQQDRPPAGRAGVTGSAQWEPRVGLGQRGGDPVGVRVGCSSVNKELAWLEPTSSPKMLDHILFMSFLPFY